MKEKKIRERKLDPIHPETVQQLNESAPNLRKTTQ
jgi:hypothetical protein